MVSPGFPPIGVRALAAAGLLGVALVLAGCGGSADDAAAKGPGTSKTGEGEGNEAAGSTRDWAASTSAELCDALGAVVDDTALGAPVRKVTPGKPDADVVATCEVSGDWVLASESDSGGSSSLQPLVYVYVLHRSEEYTAEAQVNLAAESCGAPAGSSDVGGWTMYYVNCSSSDSDADTAYVTVDADDIMLYLAVQRPRPLGSVDGMAARDLLSRLLQQ